MRDVKDGVGAEAALLSRPQDLSEGGQPRLVRWNEKSPRAQESRKYRSLVESAFVATYLKVLPDGFGREDQNRLLILVLKVSWIDDVEPPSFSLFGEIDVQHFIGIQVVGRANGRRKAGSRELGPALQFESAPGT